MKTQVSIVATKSPLICMTRAWCLSLMTCISLIKVCSCWNWNKKGGRMRWQSFSTMLSNVLKTQFNSLTRLLNQALISLRMLIETAEARQSARWPNLSAQKLYSAVTFEVWWSMPLTKKRMMNKSLPKISISLSQANRLSNKLNQLLPVYLTAPLVPRQVSSRKLVKLDLK